MGETETITVATTSTGHGSAGEPGRSVDLPVVELLTGRGFVTGKSGSGKSNTASVVAEKLLDGGFGLLIVDIDGEYYGLKEEYEILHAGGDEECDIQVTEEHAGKLASLALEQNVPIILDVSSFLDEDEAAALLREVSKHLFAKAKKQKQPFLMLVEEVHEWIPENGSVGEVGKLLIKIGKRGRKHGLGIVGISQRPADVKKDFITQCDWLVWHRLTWNNDTKVVKRILDAEYADAVEDLDDGEAFLMTDWAESIRRVQFHRKQTFDAGATPGLDDFERPELKSVSDDLVDELADISEEQQATEDRIEELREQLDEKNSRIAELEKELQDARDMRRVAEQFTEALLDHVEGANPGRTVHDDRRRRRDIRRGESDDATTGGDATASGDARAGADGTASADTASVPTVERDGGTARVDAVAGGTASDPTPPPEPEAAASPEPEATASAESDDQSSSATATVSSDDDEATTSSTSGTETDDGSTAASKTASNDGGSGGGGTTDEDSNGEWSSEVSSSEESAGLAGAADVDPLGSTDDGSSPAVGGRDVGAVGDSLSDAEAGGTDAGGTDDAGSAAGSDGASESDEESGSLLGGSDGGGALAFEPGDLTGSDDDDTEAGEASTATSKASTGETASTDESSSSGGESSLLDGVREWTTGVGGQVLEDATPRYLRDLEREVEELGEKRRRMLAHYVDQGADTPVHAHFSAGGSGDRTDAYAHNRSLRTAGFVEHAGRGRYDERLADLVRERASNELSEEEVADAVERLTATIESSRPGE